MKNKSTQISIATLLVFLLLAIADLLPFWMPNMVQMIILLVIVILLIAWAVFIVYEEAHDERELNHTMSAGRVAYLSGISVLTIALLQQGLAHTIDPWIPVALATMVVSKLGSRLYLEHYK